MSGLNISFKISAIDDFSNTMSKLNNETKKAFDNVGNIGAGFTAAGAGVALGLGYAVKTAADFESQMSRVSAISGASGEQLEALRDTALDLGASTSKSASEVAVGMEEMAKKGFEVNEVMAAMPGIISASEASGEDLALVSNVVASALNSFGLEATEASRVADIMATAANNSSADVNDLGYAFKYAAPIANTLGYSMETLAAATGIMTDAGLEGSQAGTTLRMAMIRLSDPPKEAAKEMSNLGLNVTDAAGNMLPFDQIVQQLAESTSGMGNAAKLAALSQIFGAEAASGMLTIIDAGPDKLRKFTEELQNSEGASQKTATAMKDNLKGAVQELQGSFETLMISMGTALTPAIRAVTEALTSLVNWFNGLPAPLQTALTVMIALTAALLLITGPILILVAMLPSIVAGFGAIAGAVGLTASSLLIVIGVVVAVVAALALIGYGLTIAYQKVEWFRNMVDAAWAWIKTAWSTALTFISGIAKTVMSEVSAFFGEQLARIQAFWNENGSMIMTFVKSFMNTVKTDIQAGMQFIQGIFQAVWPIISGAVKIAWELIKTVIGTGIDIILGLVSAGMKLMEGDWKGAWQSIEQIGKDIWNNIESFFSNIDLYQIGKDIIQGLVDGIGSMGSAIQAKVESMASLIPQWAKDMLGIKSPSRVMMELGSFTSEGMAIGIMDGMKSVTNAAKSLAGAAVPEVSAPNYSAQRVSGGAQSRPSVTNNSPISITLNYSGSASRDDVLTMADLLDVELANRMAYQARISGVKGV